MAPRVYALHTYIHIYKYIHISGSYRWKKHPARGGGEEGRRMGRRRIASSPFRPPLTLERLRFSDADPQNRTEPPFREGTRRQGREGERGREAGCTEHDADKRGERRWMNRAEVVVGEWRKHGGRERRSSAGKRRTVGEGSSWDGGVAGGQCESFLRLFQWAARRKRRNVNKKAGISNNGRIYPYRSRHRPRPATVCKQVEGVEGGRVG